MIKTTFIRASIYVMVCKMKFFKDVFAPGHYEMKNDFHSLGFGSCIVPLY